MTVPRYKSVAVTKFEHVAVPGPPASANDDAIADGTDGRSQRRRVVSALVRLPDTEDGMIASAENARDAAKLERRPEEGSAQRLAVLIEEFATRPRALVTHRLHLGTRERERCREDLADSRRARG